MLTFNSGGRTVRVNCFYLLILFPCVAVLATILFPAEKYSKFDFILEQEPKSLKCLAQPLDVFDQELSNTYAHIEQIDYLSCLFFIEPENAGKSHALLLGSETVLGKALKKQFSRKKINFGEIREKHQFDLHNNSIVPYIKHVNFSVIINLDGDHGKNDKELIKYCKENKIAFINVTRTNYYKTDFFQCILEYPVWGPAAAALMDFPNPEVATYLGQNYPSSNIEATDYMWADDFADLFANKIAEIMVNSHISPEIKLLTKLFSTDEIKKVIHSINEQIDLSQFDTDLVSHANEIFEYQQNALESFNKPYLTHVTTLSQTRDVMKRFNTTMSAISSALKMYPDIGFELLVVFCSETSGKFTDFFNVPIDLQRFIRVIEVPFDFTKEAKKQLETTGFPEYFARNIGIRRARGEYITCGSCDVVPPLGLFDAARFHCFTPLSYIRTMRVLGYGKAPNITAIHQKHKKFWQTVIFPEYNSGYDNDILIDACGDMQGMHKDAWNMIRGYIESRYTFNIDAVLAFERASLAGPLYIQFFAGGVHIEHMKVSDQTQHIDPWDDNIRKSLAVGKLTHYELFPRFNWGAGNVTFEEYKIENN